MHTLKLWSIMHGLSILVIAPSRDNKRPKPATLANVLGHAQICQQADTVFTLAPSTFGTQFRYLKHLASPREIIHNNENLLTFELTRSQGLTGPQASRLPEQAAVAAAVKTSPPFTVDGRTCNTGKHSLPERGVVANAAADGVVLPNGVKMLITTTTPSPQLPIAPPPFLALTYLGPSTEQDHLRNYAAEAEAANRAQESALKRLTRRTATATLVDGILDGSYGRYLRGDD